MTNYEFLKSLSIEEMATFLAIETARIANIPLLHFGQEPVDTLTVARVRLEWLKSEVDTEQSETE